MRAHQRVSARARLTVLFGALAAVAVLVPAGSASAVELNGGWAPHDRCPVDDPGMLAADGIDNTGVCVTAHAESGTFKIRKRTATTGDSDLQFGFLVEPPLPFNPLFPGTGGAVQADPVEVPGGLLNLSRNAGPGGLGDLARSVDESEPNKVTATVESAGAPSDFDTVAALVGGRPIIRLPVKIHLEHPVLGPNCFIGSEENPIVLRPERAGPLTLDVVSFDPDGTLNPSGEYASLVVTMTQQDDTFRVPRADGCGPGGVLDGLVNSQVGLPSPPGKNLLALDDSVSTLTLNQAGVDGQTFSDDWHSAVLP